MLLASMNMIPVFRIRDGWNSLSENDKSFEACSRIFHKKEAVIIFPEGNHGDQRRLRPLSKGFTRVVFEALRQDPALPIFIVPVGLNYTNPTAFRSSVSVYFGEPLPVNEYVTIDDPPGANRLRKDVATRMKSLITHIEDIERYPSIIQELEKTSPDYLDPVQVNQQIARIEKGEAISEVANHSPRVVPVFQPVRYLAQIINFLPLLVWHRILRRIKDPVFIASLKFGVGIFLFPLYYFLTGTLLYVLGGPWWILLSWGVLAPFSTWFLAGSKGSEGDGAL
jgi:hypothetical protein